MNLLYLIVAIYLILGVYARIGPYSPQEVLNLSPEEVKAWLQQPECIMLGLDDAQTFEEYQTRLAYLKSQWDYNNFQEGTELHKIAVKIIVKLKLFPKESSEFGKKYSRYLVTQFIENKCSPSLVSDILKLATVNVDDSLISSLFSSIFLQDDVDMMNAVSDALPQIDLSVKSWNTHDAFHYCAYNCIRAMWPNYNGIDSDDLKLYLYSVGRAFAKSTPENHHKCDALLQFIASKVIISKGEKLSDYVLNHQYVSSQYVLLYGSIADYKAAVDYILSKDRYSDLKEYFSTEQQVDLINLAVKASSDDNIRVYALLKSYKTKDGVSIVKSLLTSARFNRKHERLVNALSAVLNLKIQRQLEGKQTEVSDVRITQPSRFKLFWAKRYLAWKSYWMGVR
ncbi:hypothetical protein MP228_013149 [Amoeboaphelidium protococcarum]|nr:hypothetical protein MP228_013149 [Amoeboaphelidium protococcarum]